MKIYSHKQNTENVQEFYFENQTSNEFIWAHIIVDLKQKEFLLKKEIKFDKYEFDEVSNFPFPSEFFSSFLKKTNNPVKEFEVYERRDIGEKINLFGFKDKKSLTHLLEIKIDNVQKEFLARYSNFGKTNSPWIASNKNINPVLLFNEFLRSEMTPLLYS
jgi:hypothetical protein